MELRANSYYKGALERVDDSRELLTLKRYTAAVYLAGRAVEAMFRAYFFRNDKQLDTGHHLINLASKCGIYDYIGIGGGQEALAAAVQSISRLWYNDLRYTSRDMFYKRIKKYPMYKGNDEKVAARAARDAVNAALKITKTGVAVWNRKSRI